MVASDYDFEMEMLESFLLNKLPLLYLIMSQFSNSCELNFVGKINIISYLLASIRLQHTPFANSVYVNTM